MRLKLLIFSLFLNWFCAISSYSSVLNLTPHDHEQSWKFENAIFSSFSSSIQNENAFSSLYFGTATKGLTKNLNFSLSYGYDLLTHSPFSTSKFGEKLSFDNIKGFQFDYKAKNGLNISLVYGQNLKTIKNSFSMFSSSHFWDEKKNYLYDANNIDSIRINFNKKLNNNIQFSASIMSSQLGLRKK